MTGKSEDEIDWSVTTWKGSRLQQHRAFHALPFARKLELIEEMLVSAAFFSTPEPPSVPATVNEDAPQAKPGRRE
jgi:hypothetical protein